MKISVHVLDNSSLPLLLVEVTGRERKKVRAQKTRSHSFFEKKKKSLRSSQNASPG